MPLLLSPQYEALSLLIGWLFAGLAFLAARRSLLVCVVLASLLQAASQASLIGTSAWALLPWPLSLTPVLVGAQQSLAILAGNALLAGCLWLTMQWLRRYASHCAELYRQRFEQLVDQDQPRR